MTWHHIKDELPPYNKVVLAIWPIHISKYQEATECRLLIRFRGLDKERDSWRWCSLKVTPLVGFAHVAGDFPPEILYWKYMDIYFPLKLFESEYKPVDSRFELMDL